MKKPLTKHISQVICFSIMDESGAIDCIDELGQKLKALKEYISNRTKSHSKSNNDSVLQECVVEWEHILEDIKKILYAKFNNKDLDDNFLEALRKRISVVVKPLINKAVESGLFDAVKKLLSSNYIELNDEQYFDYYLVIKVLDKGGVELAKLLIEKGCRVYKATKSNQEKTVLHAAIKSEDKELIETLLAKGASSDILHYDEEKRTPFHMAIDCNQLFINNLFLSQFDAGAFDKKYLLHYAIQKDDVVVVMQLITKGLSLKQKNEKGLTPFCVALNNENFRILDELLLHHSVKDVKSNDHNDIAPAYIAIALGNLKVIKKYVNSGLSISTSFKLSKDTWTCLKNFILESEMTLLHFAVKLVKLKIVNFLLKVGADILAKNESGSCPLHIALETKEKGIWRTWQEFDNNNSIIDLILNAHLQLDSNPTNNHGLSVFHIACSRDKPKVVEHFLKLGVSINKPVSSGCHLYKEFFPLHFAAKFRCKKTVEVLLKNGADVKQKDFQRMTALHIAAKESCLETVSLLLQYSADVVSIDSNGNTPVHLAFDNKNYKIIDLLLSVPNVTNSNPTNKEGISHFHIACTRNNVNVVKSFIKSGVSLDSSIPAQSGKDNNSDVADWIGYSPLHFAVSHNRAKIVELLLDSGANVGIKDNKGLTPFHLACHYSYDMFGELIKDVLCDLSKHKKIIRKLHSLTDIIKVDTKYIQFSGIFPWYKNRGRARIDWSSNRKDHLKIINTLLDYESDVNSTDNKGNAPLLYVYDAVTKVEDMLKNNLKCSESLWNTITGFLGEELNERRKLIISNLLELDVNLDKCYKNGSILHCVISNHEKDKQSGEILKLFLKKGADVNAENDEKRTPLHQAILEESKSHVSILLDHGAEVDSIDPETNTTLLLTAASKFKSSNSYGEIIKILLDKGANPNARKSDGRTALHVLASLSSWSMGPVFSVLIEAGANVNSRDSKGHTPLHVACGTKNEDALESLLMRGADINIEDKEERTVYCYLYEEHLEELSWDDDEDEEVPRDVKEMMEVLQKHIIKMNVIGLPISKKAFESNSEFDDFQSLDDEEEVELVEKCQREVQVFKDTRIHGNCSLLDVIFKSENALSRLVKIRAFRTIYTVNCKLLTKTYPQYGYLVKLKYQAGVERGKLLPKARLLLHDLVGVHLPYTCSENICKYFSNAELRESIEILRGILDLNVKSSNEEQLRGSRMHKRQKVN